MFWFILDIQDRKTGWDHWDTLQRTYISGWITSYFGHVDGNREQKYILNLQTTILKCFNQNYSEVVGALFHGKFSGKKEKLLIFSPKFYVKLDLQLIIISFA